MRNKTIVACAFPASGKTYVCENQDKYGLKIIDLDSSNFSWENRKRTPEELLKEEEKWKSEIRLQSWENIKNKRANEIIKRRNPNFPQNYIDCIKENIGKVDIIFVSCHLDVRKALNDNGIDYVNIIPSPSTQTKYEWVGRCFCRGNDEKFCKLISHNFYNWIESMRNDMMNNECCVGILVLSHEKPYISSIINTIETIPGNYKK